jgi:hypothetical protein|tara:strand:- start:937 stop:1308 length:372 start_codon:yes stop_codon:yes gene_type:complete
MGYRSEIIAGVPVKDKKQALSIIDDWDYTAECKVRHWGTETNQYRYFYMKANAWKWYDHPIGDGYEEVVAFRKFIEADEENRFIVGVGEEGETYPDTGDWHEHDIYIHTHIDDDAIEWNERNE